MKTTFISILALSISAHAFAAEDPLNPTNDINDKITATEEAVDDNFALSGDTQRFNNTQYDQNWKGSLSGSYSKFNNGRDETSIATGEVVDSSSASIGARLTKGTGKWNHTIGLSYELSDITTKGNTDDSNSEEANISYEVNRALSDRFYVFGLGTATFSGGISDDFDGVVAFGPGYRIVNNDNMTWRVQAGASYNYASQNLIDNVTNLSLTDAVKTQEAGTMASSRFWYKLSDTAAITNDTDFFYTKSNTSATNDLGVTFKVTDAFSTRIGYRVEFDDFSSEDISNVDYSGSTNKFTTAVVYGF